MGYYNSIEHKLWFSLAGCGRRTTKVATARSLPGVPLSCFLMNRSLLSLGVGKRILSESAHPRLGCRPKSPEVEVDTARRQPCPRGASRAVGGKLLPVAHCSSGLWITALLRPCLGPLASVEVRRPESLGIPGLLAFRGVNLMCSGRSEAMRLLGTVVSAVPTPTQESK